MTADSSRGNVLFFILIAVALFAALSYAVSKSSSGGGPLSGERLRLTADEIIQYGNGLRAVTERLILVKNVAEINTSGNGILFSATGANAAYGVVGAQPTTEIFNLSGGAAKYQVPPSDACLSACAYEFSGQYTITNVKDNANPELVMLVIDVDPTVCAKLNSVLDNGFSSIPTGGALTLTRFDGTAYGGANAITLNGGFAGKQGFCYQESSGGGRYIYVHVLRAR